MQGKRELYIFAQPKAGAVFNSYGIEAELLESVSSYQVLSNRLKTLQPNIIITGTSHYEPFESFFWLYGKKAGIHSCAVLDGWFNLDQRFRNGRPDKIFAIDEDQKTKLAKFGIPPTTIECVGQIWLSELHSTKKSTVTPKSLIKKILFISEPIKEDVASKANSPYGFDQFKAFRLLKEAAKRVALSKSPVHIDVKLHPYEKLANWKKEGLLINDKKLSINICSENINCNEFIKRSNLVTGISSIALLQAICMGKPVLSLQPNLHRENTFIAAARGFVETILTENEAAIQKIAFLIFDNSEKNKTLKRNKMFFESLVSGGIDLIIRWIYENEK